MVKSLRLGALFFSILIFALAIVSIQRERWLWDFTQVDNAAHIGDYLTSYLKEPTRIEHVTLSWRGSHPIIELNGLSVKDQKDNSLLFINKVQLSIDWLSSLLTGKVVIGDLSIISSSLTFQERGGGIIDINNIPTLRANLNTPNSEKVQALMRILLSCGVKRLQDVDINWLDNVGNEILSVKKLKLVIEGTTLRHQVTGSGLVWGHSISLSGTILGSLFAKDMLFTRLELAAENIPLDDNRLIKHFYSDLKSIQALASIEATLKSNPFQKMKISGSFFGKKIAISTKSVEALTSKNISGQFNVKADKVYLLLDGDALQLDYPALFRSSLLLNKIRGRLSWRKLTNLTTLNIRDYEVIAPEGRISGFFKIKLPKGDSPQVQSRATFELSDLSKTAKYYPAAIMSKTILNWLDHSIRAGQLTRGVFILNGKLKNFPFDNKKGKFLIRANLQNGKLLYAKHWPMLSALNASLVFSARTMHINVHSASLLGALVPHLTADIKNLEHGVLSLTGNLQTQPNQTLLIEDDINPLSQYSTLKALKNVTISGPLKLGLNLKLPLESGAKSPAQFMGNIALDGTNLGTTASAPEIQGAHGLITFSDHSINSNQVSGKLLGNSFYLTMNTAQQGNANQMHLKLQSAISVQDLRERLPAPIVTNLHGATPVEVDLNLVKLPDKLERWELRLFSDLKGLGSTLPSPLDKSPELRTPLELRVLANTQTLTSQFRFEHRFNGYIKWLRTDHDMQLEQGRIFLDSINMKGSVQIPARYPEAALQARFSLLALSPQSSELNFQPNDVPPFDLYVDSLLYKDKTIHNVDLKVRPHGDSLLIKQFQLKESGLKVLASGLWHKSNNEQATSIKGTLESTNLGVTLSQWRITDNLLKGKGNAQFNLTWKAAPTNPDLNTLDGVMKLDFKEGTITKLSNQANLGMGLGRILNLLSLQTLPRRLMGNFSDLTSSGFNFDETKGTLSINKGNIYTDDAVMEGVVGKVKINGRIGLPRKDYDLRLIINPNVTSSLPVVATLTAGPIAGAVTWLADKVFSRQLKKMTEIHYTVTGTWAQPTLQTVLKPAK